MLRVEGLHTYYGQGHVLQGVDLEVPAGRIAAVLGRNGVGKTTTLRSIVGLTPPRRGQVLLAGRDVAGWAPHRIARVALGRGRDRILEIEDHGIGAGGAGLVEAFRPVAGHEQEGAFAHGAFSSRAGSPGARRAARSQPHNDSALTRAGSASTA